MSNEMKNLYPGAYLPELSKKPAVIMADTGEQLSYEDMDGYANRLGRLYQWLGLRNGDHVAYCVENRLECPAIQWGAHYVGLYYTFVSTRLKAQEAAYIVSDCEAKVLVVSAETAPEIIEAIQALDSPPKIFTLDEYAGLELLDDACSKFGSDPIKDTLEGSEMLYSSGTTGVPKGVKPDMTGLPLGSTSVIGGLLQKGFGVDQSTVYLSPAPYYHAAPLKWCQAVTALGGTVVMTRKFRSLDVLNTIDMYKVTHSQWVPTMFSRLLELSAEEKGQFSLESMKVAVHAAAPCPIPVKQAMIDWWGPILVEYYSCTEAIGMTMVTSQEWEQKPGTVGRSLLGQVHIVDDNGKPCPAGEDGLVYFSDGQRFSYHKDQAKTDEAYNENGWSTVGDVGNLDDEGYLFLTDRKSNMIISGGVNIYPQEVENLLITHPKIYDAAVIGTPHVDFGEEVRAVVQLNDGVVASDSLKEELIGFSRDNLSSIKCPRVVSFRDSLPREPNGKLLKRLLIKEFS